MIKTISFFILLIAFSVFAASEVKAQIPNTLDTTNSGVLKQCATICLRINEKQQCKSKLAFHYNDNRVVDGFVISIYDFKTAATLDLNEEKRRAVVTVFDEMTANIQTDSLVQFVKVEVTQFNKTETFSITKSEYQKMEKKRKIAELFLEQFMAGEYHLCYNHLDPSIKSIFSDSLFQKSCRDIVVPRGPFKSYTFTYFEEKVIGYQDEQFWVFAFDQIYAYDEATSKYTIRKAEGNDFIFGYEVK